MICSEVKLDILKVLVLVTSLKDVICIFAVDHFVSKGQLEPTIC
jgi:hypothetical protein